jgi:hypothetical protein
MYLGPAKEPNGYPWDLAPALNFTRPAPYVPFHPWPNQPFGALLSFMPLANTYIVNGKAPPPSGPNVNAPFGSLFKFLTNPNLAKTG